jgi:hypothetical protein
MSTRCLGLTLNRGEGEGKGDGNGSDSGEGEEEGDGDPARGDLRSMTRPWALRDKTGFALIAGETLGEAEAGCCFCFGSCCCCGCCFCFGVDPGDDFWGMGEICC